MDMKKYHKIHPLKIVPHIHVRRETQVVIVIAGLLVAVILVALMHVTSENARLEERLEEALIAKWDLDARLTDSYAKGCFPVLQMPVETRRKM